MPSPQNADIYIAHKQEKHLSHEAWHTAQQKQHRAQPTTQSQEITINDSTKLERKAHVMAAKAMKL